MPTIFGIAIDDLLAFALAIGGIVFLVRKIGTGNDERHEEDAMRAFFDEHGHWPDEDAAAVQLAIERQREEDRRRHEDERRRAAARVARRRREQP